MSERAICAREGVGQHRISHALIGETEGGFPGGLARACRGDHLNDDDEILIV
jgi:hypothetical protein